MPEAVRNYLKQKKPPCYTFPWGERTCIAGKPFWLALACLEDHKGGWLYDYVRNHHHYMATCICFYYSLSVLSLLMSYISYIFYSTWIYGLI